MRVTRHKKRLQPLVIYAGGVPTKIGLTLAVM